MWEVGLEVVEAYVIKSNNAVMVTGDVRLGKVMGGCTNRCGGGTGTGGVIDGEINSKLAWEKYIEL